MDLLKVDFEGNEVAVLDGASKIFKEHMFRSVTFEFDEMNTVSRVFLRDILDKLNGYQVSRLLP